MNLQLPLFAASENPYQILGVKIVLAIVGLIMLGVGIYALKNKRLLVSRRAKFLLKLFGKEEITGLWATIGGAVQCLLGVCLLALPIAGPYLGLFGEGRSSRPRNSGYNTGVFGSGGPGFGGGFEEEREAYKPLPVLELADEALPSIEVGDDKSYVVLNKPMGFDGFDNFEHEMAPEGGGLVGVRVCLGGGVTDAFDSILPLFQTDVEYSMNAEPSGEPEGEEVELLAKPGFVVSGARVVAHSLVDGIQFQFRPLNDDGTLGDAGQAYWSDVLGEEASEYYIENRGAEQLFDGPVIGLSYRFKTIRKSKLEKLSFAYVDPKIAKLAQAAEVAMPTIPETATTKLLPGEDSGDDDYRYRDDAPAGAMMVGLQCDINPRGRSRFTLMRPIYQRGNSYVLGERWGPAGGTQLLMARPGYAVSGCDLASHNRGLRLKYSKVLPSGHLDVNDSYEGEWLGNEFEGESIDTASSPVVGWSFAVERGRIEGLIVKTADLGPAPATAATAAPDVTADEPIASEALDETTAEVAGTTPDETDVATSNVPEPDLVGESDNSSNIRAWTSTTGQTVEAELIAVDMKEKTIVLRRASDGKQVKIPAKLVSPNNQQYVREWMKSQQ